ncbi:cation:proton antiporter [Ahrensia marina]|uniref:Sodium:proton antiporter n=1 Tax=Ahrensia marina TaxID=1514904 RepID=A0A0M9GPE5_9HYPH|nr:sodium:proton antiporter [Ahrensia marina]
MSSEFLNFSVQFALVLLSAAFLLTVLKVIKGPTLPDRILALDMLVATAIGFIAVIGLKTGYTLYVDVAIALGLVGFLATVAFARFILARGQTEEGREKKRLEESQKQSETEKPSVEPDTNSKVVEKPSKKPVTAKKTASQKVAKTPRTRSRKTPKKPETKS